MKQVYFSPASVERKAVEMLRKVEGLRQRHHQPFAPERSALLILDMQNYFLDATSHAYIPSAPAILPHLRALIQAYSSRGLPLILTQHLNTPQDAGMLVQWWHDVITDGNPLSAIAEALDRSSGIVMKKSQYDAFHGTDLEDVLRGRSVTQVVICGVMTHLCCETTARSAFVRGFEVFFAIDGTATYTEDFHMATLLNLSHGVAMPVLTGELLAALRRDDER